MALSGPQALKSLDDAVRDVRREEDEISKRLARSAERAAKLREQEAEFFLQLAELRLDPAVRSQITGPLSQAEQNVRQMLDQHVSDVAALEAELQALDASMADKARQRAKLLEKTDAHQAELKALSAAIAKAIEQKPDYASKHTEAERLRGIAAESLAKTEQAEADQEQKGRPYREDPLFMYLWEAGYGTRNYNANNLVRWLDAMVARLVDFDKARPNFVMLNEIPVRLREHAERQVALTDAAEAALDAMEIEAIDAAGGKPIREALAQAQAHIETLDTDMIALEDERDEKARAYRHLVEGRDPNFTEARKELASSLERGDLNALLASARRTATAEDDALIARIEDVRVRIAEEEDGSSDDKARLKVLAARRRELEDIEYEFKKSRFDDPRSTFRQDDLAGDMLNEFLKGAVTAATYWAAWQKSQGWKSGTTDWGGGFGLPRSGRTSVSRGGFSWPSGTARGSGGFSRPRTGTRGSRKSGGFKTGGGF